MYQTPSCCQTESRCQSAVEILSKEIYAVKLCSWKRICFTASCEGRFKALYPGLLALQSHDQILTVAYYLAHCVAAFQANGCLDHVETDHHFQIQGRY